METRREREKQRRRREDARQHAREEQPRRESGDDTPARPGDHIETVDQYLEHHDLPEAVFYGRCSERHQDPASQKRGARQLLRGKGVAVRYAWCGIETGKSLDPEQRPGLMAAIARARQLGIPLVLTTMTRGVRNEHYHAYHCPDLRLTAAEFREFLRLSEGVTVLTLSDPDAAPADDESFLRELTAKAKRSKVGRHRKTGRPRKGDLRSRDNWEPRLRELLAQGLTRQDAARQLVEDFNTTVQTAYRWLRSLPDGACKSR